MTIRNYFRNRIAGFIFGRYKLDEIASNYLNSKEKFIKGIEIVHWGEGIYLILLIMVILNVIASFLISSFFLILLFIYVPVLLLIATKLELIIVTDERVLIEKRSIIEKITRTQQFQAVSIDQIAMISYARAPPNVGLLFFSGIGFLVSVTPLLGQYFDIIDTNEIILFGLTILLIIPFFYLFWFGLRLNKRSIELSVIGLRYTVGIGRIKGAPVIFLIELQNLITERIHHIQHQETKEEVEQEMIEFPLQYSALVKDLVKEAGDSIAKAVLMQLDSESLDIQEIYSALPQYTTDHVDDELSYLKNKTLIVYNPEKEHWELNRNYKRKFLHEKTQQGL